MGCVNDKNSHIIYRKPTIGLEHSSKFTSTINVDIGSEAEVEGRDENYLRDDEPVRLPIDPYYDFISTPLRLPATGEIKISAISSK